MYSFWAWWHYVGSQGKTTGVGCDDLKGVQSDLAPGTAVELNEGVHNGKKQVMMKIIRTL